MSTGGGSVDLVAPSTASNLTVTLPNTTGTLADLGSVQTVTGVKNFSNGLQIGGSETLTTYDEGTWTPSITAFGGSTSSSVGTYTRIGRLLYLYPYSAQRLQQPQELRIYLVFHLYLTGMLLVVLATITQRKAVRFGAAMGLFIWLHRLPQRQAYSSL
jgi:hypothetical protein